MLLASWCWTMPRQGRRSIRPNRRCRSRNSRLTTRTRKKKWPRSKEEVRKKYMKYTHIAGLLMVLATSGLVCAQGSLYRNPGYVESEVPFDSKPRQLEGVGIDEKLSQKVDLDLT